MIILSKKDKLDKEIKEVEEEIGEYIHSIADIKMPTVKEFNRNRKRVLANVIAVDYYYGVAPTSDIVYDVTFRYIIDNIIYTATMQTQKLYKVGENVNVYYYKKDPSYIREINDNDNSEHYLASILMFAIMFVLASIIFVMMSY